MCLYLCAHVAHKQGDLGRFLPECLAVSKSWLILCTVTRPEMLQMALSETLGFEFVVYSTHSVQVVTEEHMTRLKRAVQGSESDEGCNENR